MLLRRRHTICMVLRSWLCCIKGQRRFSLVKYFFVLFQRADSKLSLMLNPICVGALVYSLLTIIFTTGLLLNVLYSLTSWSWYSWTHDRYLLRSATRAPSNIDGSSGSDPSPPGAWINSCSLIGFWVRRTEPRPHHSFLPIGWCSQIGKEGRAALECGGFPHFLTGNTLRLKGTNTKIGGSPCSYRSRFTAESNLSQINRSTRAEDRARRPGSCGCAFSSSGHWRRFSSFLFYSSLCFQWVMQN